MSEAWILPLVESMKLVIVCGKGASEISAGSTRVPSVQSPEICEQQQTYGIAQSCAASRRPSYGQCMFHTNEMTMFTQK